MKKILVPVDFSEAADNAVRYTVELSASLLEPIELILFHVYDAHAATTGAIPTEIELHRQLEEEQKALEKLKAYARTYCRHSGIRSCLTMVSKGNLPGAIALAALHTHADMIVMGTKGANGGAAAFFTGTNTSDLIERASCPVLAVPEPIPFRSILKIVFATDLSKTDLNDLRLLATLAVTLNAQVQVVHVSGLGEEGNDAGRIVQFWSEVQQQVRYPWMEFINLEADEVAEGLERFVLEQEADLLVVCPKKRSIFHQMIYGSTTRQLVIDALVPLLTLPHSQEERNRLEAEKEAALLPDELNACPV